MQVVASHDCVGVVLHCELGGEPKHVQATWASERVPGGTQCPPTTAVHALHGVHPLQTQSDWQVCWRVRITAPAQPGA